MSSISTGGPSINGGVPPVPSIWRQQIVVFGESLQLLRQLSNYEPSDPAVNALILHGEGLYFPAMKGTSWAAGCAPSPPKDGLDDITPILNTLLDTEIMVFSNATRAEVEAWIQARGNPHRPQNSGH